ncbi:MAG TPA: hypothetical protein PL078_05190 [Bacillota bacterium]|jgi:hypothetical protein|nr:hypothetical protein [Peptococcaceae bacterium MAG4]NLW38997.1 hypothetical protein [Peptococcaceae bacterium]HPZ43379.1 hypothetical protein [Bacillota bacterium]HQD76383.1 hypothetical protein [Bacillota bacterium]HUM58924.1 hypothetical protein [Bacillota bacterium]
MGDSAKAELVKWRRLVLLATVSGVAIFSLPWISGRYKIMLALPLYAMFVYVFYKYLCVKREASAGVYGSVKQTPPGVVKAGKGNRNNATTAKKRRKGR